MKKEKAVFWVDLPDPDAIDENSCYVNVGTFERLQEALAFLSERYGMPSRIARFFVTKGAE